LEQGFGLFDLGVNLREVLKSETRQLLQVLCTQGTIAAANEARKQGRPQWRVSSTVFSQVASDEVLRPLGKFATPEPNVLYPATVSGQYVEDELQAINLKAQ
jgi:hypothetical protein